MKKSAFSIFILVLMASCAEQAVKPISEKPMTQQKTVATATKPGYDREKAKALYETACYKCHDLYKPSEYTDEQWVPIMKSMAPKAHLNAEESALVLQYLTTEN